MVSLWVSSNPYERIVTAVCYCTWEMHITLCNFQSTVTGRCYIPVDMFKGELICIFIIIFKSWMQQKSHSPRSMTEMWEFKIDMQLFFWWVILLGWAKQPFGNICIWSDVLKIYCSWRNKQRNRLSWNREQGAILSPWGSLIPRDYWLPVYLGQAASVNHRSQMVW